MVNDQMPEKIITDVVEMLPDGTLKIASGITEKNGMNSADSWIAEPGTPDFIEFGTRHKVNKPGQACSITKRLINGEWHIEEKRFGDD